MTTTGDDEEGLEPLADELGLPKFKHITEIGHGGFSTVYKARDGEHDRWAAIKLFRDDRGKSAEIAKAFETERKAIGSLDGCSSIVSLYTSGYNDNGVPYLEMKYMAGGSLRDHLDEEGPLPWEEAVKVALPVLDALDFAHAKGVIHNDVKPANILWSGDHKAKLSDFGVSTIRSVTTTELSAHSLRYTPPEFFENRRRDERSDLYSLAATLYALIAGRPPFGAKQSMPPAEVMLEIREDKPRRIPEDRCPKHLSDLIMRALRKNPDKRPQDAREFRRLLEEASTDGPPNSRWTTVLDRLGDIMNQNPPWQRRLTLAASVVSLAAMGAGLIGYVRSQDDTTLPPVPTSTTEPVSNGSNIGTESITGPPEGKPVVLWGALEKIEAEALEATLTDQFGPGQIRYELDNDIGTLMTAGIPAGGLPNIAILPQPGVVRGLASREQQDRSVDIEQIPESTRTLSEATWGQEFIELSKVGPNYYGIPIKSDLKSLVWYLPDRLEDYGGPPDTWDGFRSLVGEINSDQNDAAPLCVGIGESEPQDGGNDASVDNSNPEENANWIWSDWMENIVLREKGRDFYQNWRHGNVDLDDQAFEEAARLLQKLWTTPGNVHGGASSISSTPLDQAAQDLLDGNCLMHIQGGFFATEFPEGTEFVNRWDQNKQPSPNAVDVFALPINPPTEDAGGEGESVSEHGLIMSLDVAVMFDDSTATAEVMEFMAGIEFANGYTEHLGNLSGSDSPEIRNFLPLYGTGRIYPQSPLEITISEIYKRARDEDPPSIYFDASDNMPAGIGTECFPDVGGKLLSDELNLDDLPEELATIVEDGWPSCAAGS